MRLEEIRPNGDGPVVAYDRLFELAEVLQCQPEIVMGAGIGGTVSNRLGDQLDGERIPAALDRDEAEHL
jgi:hypothetical protein